MFEAFVITLREGVEAALVLAIAGSLLRRRGLGALTGALLAGALVAVAVSAILAVLATRLTYNEELVEGAAMLVGAVLVLTLVWWMWKTAPHLRQEIETGLDRAAGSGRGGMFGVFLFGFGMVLREGFETAIFLSAAEFNSKGVGLWVGALGGLTLATVFGVLFARGAIKVPLKAFFSLTSVVLLLFAFQLLVGGLHELSEGQLLPSSRAEMALIGPLVKNELLLFTLTIALAAGWLLLGAGRTAAATADTEGPQARLERAARARDVARRRWTGALGLLVVGFLSVAFVQKARLPGKEAAQALAPAGGAVRFERAALADGRMHFYEAPLGNASVRFFALQVGNDTKLCFDACEICGDRGYFLDGGAVICRNCTSPIALQTLGRTGGCNPIPLPHHEEAGQLVVLESDLAAVLPKLQGR